MSLHFFCHFRFPEALILKEQSFQFSHTIIDIPTRSSDFKLPLLSFLAWCKFIELVKSDSYMTSSPHEVWNVYRLLHWLLLLQYLTLLFSHLVFIFCWMFRMGVYRCTMTFLFLPKSFLFSFSLVEVRPLYVLFSGLWIVLLWILVLAETDHLLST